MPNYGRIAREQGTWLTASDQAIGLASDVPVLLQSTRLLVGDHRSLEPGARGLIWYPS